MLKLLWFTENTIYAFGLCFDIIVKGTLKWLVIFRYIEEGATLTLKIMSKIPAEPYFSCKKAEKVEKLVLLWQK